MIFIHHTFPDHVTIQGKTMINFRKREREARQVAKVRMFLSTGERFSVFCCGLGPTGALGGLLRLCRHVDGKR